MTRLSRLLSIACLAILAAACSDHPKLVAGTPENITLQYKGDDLPETRQRADRYCGTFGKVARMETTTRQGGDNVAVFSCL
jgi:PBP1b-binding outer membrane lipoprotein LpoB